MVELSSIVIMTMLFETIIGNILIMVIGLIIIFLSYKFEKIKDYVDNFETN